MTGQILGGSSVIDAARYQILITYLIAACAFGAIFSHLFFALRVCFDSRMILRTDRLKKRDKKPNALTMLKNGCEMIISCCRFSRRKLRHLSSSDAIMGEETKYLAPKGEMKVLLSGQKNGQNPGAFLVASDLTYSFENPNQSDGSNGSGKNEEGDLKEPTRRVLFQNFSLQVQEGGMVLVDGPSGIGKSSLLRIVAGLAAPDCGNIELSGRQMSTVRDMSWWRSQVMYVPQTKVDIPGTPIDLMKKISAFGVRSGQDSSTTYHELKAKTVQLITDWEMNLALLDSEWKNLSGGESQRFLIALALASRPRVILLDESTSAMDVDSKVKVETSVKNLCAESGMCAIWITHDQGQKERLFKNN